MPRQKPFDEEVEKAVRELLKAVPRSQFDDFQKAVNTAINWAKVKHKIEEGSAGSAFGTPEDDPPI